MKRKLPGILTALALCLALLPVSAFAASTAPKITAIGGNENLSISTSQSGSGWSYDAASTTLTLNGYKGGRIELVGDARQQLTVKLVGNNTITASGSAYGLTATSADSSYSSTTDNYMKFTITTDQYATLTVNGIRIGGRINFEISGDASIASRTTAENICALQGADYSAPCSVSIQDHANVHLASGVNQTQNSFCLVPIHGNLTVNTTGSVEIDASSTGGPAIQLYGSVNTFLYKVKELLIKWTAGGYSLHMSSTAPYSENEGNSGGYGIAVLHTPYVEVNVPSDARLEYKRINLMPQKSFIQVGKGEQITITASAPEAGKRFKNWTLTCKSLTIDDLKFVAGSASTDSITIEIPDPELIPKNSTGFRTLKFTPNYEDIPATGVTLDKTSLTLVRDESANLTAAVLPTEATQTVTWSSDAPDIATVDESGTVRAIQPGTATITATASVKNAAGEDVSANCVVTVVAPPSITYVLNGGTNHTDNPSEYRHGVGVIELFAPTRAGYTFGGWYRDAAFRLDPVTSIPADSNEDITLYAKWIMNVPPRSDGSTLADETGSVNAEASGTDGRITGFTAGGKSLDYINLRGLDLCVTLDQTTLSLSPAAIRQLLDANAGSLTLQLPSGTMTIPQEMLRDIQPLLNGKDLDISLLSGEEALGGLTAAQQKWLQMSLKERASLAIGALTGEFSIGGEPLDWSKISGSLDIGLTLKTNEKNTGWHLENNRWFYEAVSADEELLKSLPSMKDFNNYFSLNFVVMDENGNLVTKTLPLNPPSIMPLPEFEKDAFYVGLAQDWDFPRSEDIKPELKWQENGFSLDFKLPHFSTYLVLLRSEMPFGDVSDGAYYFDAVKWALQNDITGGTTPNTFSPDASCTRGQLAAFLYRAAGSPEPKGVDSFSDVPENSYYAKAIAWAAENGIITGMGDGKFAPNSPCTRAQAVTMLYRYAKHLGKDVSIGEDTNILSFEDAFDLGEWAIPAVQWACGAGVMQGSGEKLMPNDACTRSQIVTFLYRALEET